MSQSLTDPAATTGTPANHENQPMVFGAFGKILLWWPVIIVGYVCALCSAVAPETIPNWATGAIFEVVTIAWIMLCVFQFKDRLMVIAVVAMLTLLTLLLIWLGTSFIATVAGLYGRHPAGIALTSTLLLLVMVLHVLTQKSQWLRYEFAPSFQAIRQNGNTVMTITRHTHAEVRYPDRVEDLVVPGYGEVVVVTERTSLAGKETVLIIEGVIRPERVAGAINAFVAKLKG